MNTRRIMIALSIIDTERLVCELAIVGWSKMTDTSLKYTKRQLKAKTLGIVKHDRILNWRT